MLQTKNPKLLLPLYTLALVALLSTGCSKRHMAAFGLSKDPVVTDEEINAEAGKAYEDVKKKAKISTNQKWTDLVHRVSMRIARASNVNYNWEVVLIEEKEPNAWCMPGGKMAVYTGILPILKTEGALAAVMGHEVAHATLKHGKQRYARSIRSQTAGLLLGGGLLVGGQLLCKTQKCKTLTALGGVASAFLITFLDRKFSRDDESAADHTGQLYMARAGYDPSEAAQVWERMSAAGGKGPPEFLSTHPSNENRKENLTAWLPAAMEEYKKTEHRYGVGEKI